MSEFKEDLKKLFETGNFELENQQKRKEFDEMTDFIVEKYEPKPLVEIEQWVADEIELNIKQSGRGRALRWLLDTTWTSVEFDDWLVKVGVEFLVRAIYDGYVIKEKKLYVLKNKKTGNFLYIKYKDEDRESIMYFDECDDTQENILVQCKFTDEEISKMTDIEGYTQVPLSEVDK